MSMPGIGVMINMLAENRGTVEAVTATIGKQIESITLENDELVITVDSHKLTIKDDGQSCCESRYMVTDDDLPYFVGARINRMFLSEVEEKDDDGEVHEIQFLKIETDKGMITVANHNQHNGYYGGFWIAASMSEQ